MSLVNSEFGDEFDAPQNEQDGFVSNEPVVSKPSYRKQSFSIYSLMLILSFVFLVVAAILFSVNANEFSK
ncbi:MAG: hypothetical protein ACR2NK_11250 [Mariniblastus sp.]